MSSFVKNQTLGTNNKILDTSLKAKPRVKQDVDI